MSLLKTLFSRRWLSGTLLVLLAMGLFVRLGIWQLDRLAQRRAQNEVLRAVLDSPSLDLAEPLPDGAEAAPLENRLATVTGRYDFAQERVLLLQQWQGRPGVALVTPLLIEGLAEEPALSEGEVAVLVNRGWVPQTEYEAGQLGSYQTETGMVQVAGYLALGQPGRGDSPEVAPQEIYRIDLDAMGAALPYELLPVVLVESPAQAVALEPPLHAAREIDLSEGPHLSYAWQWFIFSVLTGGLYLVFVRRSERERPSLRNSVFLFLLIVCLLPWQTILAHGGGALQISNAPIGQYQVSVWNNPPTARAGQTLHVTVGIGRISTGEPVLDAAVSVTIVDESGESLTAAAATTAQSVNRLFYEADLDGVPIGTYEMQIEVTGSEGSGMLAFPLAVEPASLWPWLVGAVVAVGVTWLGLRSWRKEAKANVSVRRTAVPRPRSVD